MLTLLFCELFGGGLIRVWKRLFIQSRKAKADQQQKYLTCDHNLGRTSESAKSKFTLGTRKFTLTVATARPYKVGSVS
jgi:hypothetical protein